MDMPFPITDLYNIAKKDDIFVVWYPYTACPSRYVTDGDIEVIYLSPALRHSEMHLRCTLAYLLGKHMTGEDSEKAKRWARELLMPYEWICKQMNYSAQKISDIAGVYLSWATTRINDTKTQTPQFKHSSSF